MTTIISIILLFSYIVFSLFSPSKSDVLGFTADLIHRDSPASPFYNSSLTHFNRVQNALRRSNYRVNNFISVSKKAKSTSSEIIPNDGGYIMKIAIGTPPVTKFLLADTASDLTWTQCKPCKGCFKPRGSFFDPKKSSSYKALPCDSPTCKGKIFKGEIFCPKHGKVCKYWNQYGDGSKTVGVVASETIVFGFNTSTQPVYFPGIMFGCGFLSGGTYYDDESGVIGLGAGPNSFISQIKPSIDGKFSYCLTQDFIDHPINGKLNFGNNAVVSGIGVESTPIIPNKELPNFYYLNLEAISVGNHRIELFKSKSESIHKAGNIFIDSGATLTYLQNSTYHEFVNLVRKEMGNDTIPDPSKELDLCYRLNGNLSYPKVTAHFTGADVDLKPINIFVQTADDVTCLAFVPRESQVFGNIAQVNFLVGYDTIKGTVSFKRSRCGLD